MPKNIPVLAQKPKYVLRLDDLPKCIEADGRVWPIYLTLREIARLFHVEINVARKWVHAYDLPAVRIGARMYVSVPDFNDWLLAHAVTNDDDGEAEGEGD